MSGSGKGQGYTPEPRMTREQWQETGEWFKEFLGENPLVRWSIYLAGFGGLLEGAHILWLIAKFLLKR